MVVDSVKSACSLGSVDYKSCVVMYTHNTNRTCVDVRLRMGSKEHTYLTVHCSCGLLKSTLCAVGT